MTNPLTREQIENAIAELSRTINICTKVFNSPDFTSTIVINGKDVYGKKINNIVTVSVSDPDAVAFWNNYSQTLLAKRLSLYRQLEETPQIEEPIEPIN